MNKLTEEEINKYIIPKNHTTGVDAITREYLEQIDLDEVPVVTRKYDRIMDADGKQLFKLDRFTPCANSYAFHPYFAGRQILMGREGRELYFSNGRWFVRSN